MIPLPVNSFLDDTIPVNRYGIREVAGTPIDPSLLDLIVLPGCAFDIDGNRLVNQILAQFLGIWNGLL